MKRRSQFLLAFLSVASVGATLFACRPEALEDRGGIGETCYPNETCDEALTCWAIRDDRVCEAEIKPVGKGATSCFTTRTDEELCFATQEQCLTAFSRRLATTADVAKGCTL